MWSGRETYVHTLCGVTLRAGDTPKAAVKVAARGEIGDGARAVEAVECAEEGQRGDGAVEKARVRLAKGVACEDARGLLQAQYDCIHPHPSVSHRAYMYREAAYSRLCAARSCAGGLRASLGLGWRLAWIGCARRGPGGRRKHLFFQVWSLVVVLCAGGREGGGVGL